MPPSSWRRRAPSFRRRSSRATDSPSTCPTPTRRSHPGARMTPRSSRYELGLLLSLVVLLVISGIRPHDYFTWVLEVFPVLIGAPILVWIYPRFRFTR